MLPLNAEVKAIWYANNKYGKSYSLRVDDNNNSHRLELVTRKNVFRLVTCLIVKFFKQLQNKWPC